MIGDGVVEIGPADAEWDVWSGWLDKIEDRPSKQVAPLVADAAPDDIIPQIPPGRSRRRVCGTLGRCPHGHGQILQG